MRRIRIVGLCLIAVFALTAVAASSASAALPEFYECHKVAKVGEGKFSDKKCSLPGSGKTGKYELQPGIGKAKAFKGSGGAATLHTPVLKSEVTCTKSKDTGKLRNPSEEEKILVTFSGCIAEGKKCFSPGQKEGTILTNSLEGKLGYISESKKEVGVRLQPETGKAGMDAEFKCGVTGVTLKVKTFGPVIGQILKGINTFSKTTENVFTVTKEGFQTLTKFEGGPEEVLATEINGEGPEFSGEQTTATNKGEELEIKTA